ncbi:MAG: zinc-dependent metalloprotease, partial [bacterium]
MEKIKIFVILVISIFFFLASSFAINPNLKDNASLRDTVDRQFFEKAKKSQGIFNLYSYKGKNYLEIPFFKLQKEYFVSLQVSKGISIYPFLGGLTLPVFETISEYADCIYFYSKSSDYKDDLKDGDIIEIHIYSKNLKYRSSFNSASSNLLKKSFSDNLIAKVKGFYMKGSIYVDLDQLVAELPLSVNSPAFSKNINVKLNSLEEVKVFPKNMILYISFLVSFKPRMDFVDSLNLLSNNKTILALNIFECQNDNYKPREYDPRVGYFSTQYADVSSTEGKDGYRTIKKYINRWDMDKGLTIWIENTFPAEYRDDVKEGILEWNKAFNKIGYDNPIKVEIQPDDADWEPEDIRYATVRYQDVNLTAFAIGPSIALPTTGEIVDADVVFYAPMIRIIKSRFDYYYDIILPSVIKYQTNPLYKMYYELFMKSSSSLLTIDQVYKILKSGMEDLETLENQEFNHIDFCNYSLEKLENTIVGLTSIMISDPNFYNLNKEKFAKDYIKDIIIHEVGHILGLRHNFKASSFVTLEQLQDEKYTSEHGICFSCMDYNPLNVHYKNDKPYFTRDVFMTKIGQYDYWAIEYGYTKDENSLKKIASKVSLYYGPDEDIFALDPNIRSFDLSSNPYKWYENLSNVNRYVINNANYRLYKNGVNPELVYLALNSSLNSYIDIKLQNLVYYLLGKHFNRTFFGDYNKTSVEMIDSKLRDFVTNSIIRDLSMDQPLISSNSFSNAVIFGSFEWGSRSKTSKTL